MSAPISPAELQSRLAAWCERAGQASVASKCGVSQPCISRMLNGHDPIGPSVFLAMGYRRVISFHPISEAAA